MREYLEFSEIDFSKVLSRYYWVKYVPEIGLCIGIDRCNPILYRKNPKSPWVVFSKDIEYSTILKIEYFKDSVDLCIHKAERMKISERPLSKDALFDFVIEKNCDGMYYSQLYPNVKFKETPSAKEFVDGIVADLELKDNFPF
jgi:hypothetical protein